MKVDSGIGFDLHKIPEQVKAIEGAGYDGVRTAEMNHDPFFPLLLVPSKYLHFLLRQLLQNVHQTMHSINFLPFVA